MMLTQPEVAFQVSNIYKRITINAVSTKRLLLNLLEM
jgi:hypothetical protein